MSPSRAEPAALRRSAPVFAALADPTRLRLLARLGAGGPLSIARLTEGTDVTRQAVTKHLEVLAGAGLARSIRHGRERRWQLQPQPLQDAGRALAAISRQWEEALGRLRAFVED
jgi:DNA-binding transcriptional ArsR family regulator